MATVNESMSRQDLEAAATEAGLTDPGSYENKASLVAALNGASTVDTVPEPGGVSEQDRDDVLREMHETGRVRSGFVVNYSWSDVVRKAS